jgi:hypothetical protein
MGDEKTPEDLIDISGGDGMNVPAQCSTTSTVESQKAPTKSLKR